MLIRNLLILFFIVFFISCDTIFSKKENIIIEEIPINYRSIDAYPLLPECNDITDRALQKKCFYEKLSNNIQKNLASVLLVSTTNVQGNILIKVRISAIGKASIKTIIMADEIKTKIPKLDSLIRVSIHKLPVLQPAIKAGIPVASEFSLPISINFE